MLRRSLYAAILQSRALHVALPALSSVPNSLLRPLGSSNAASFHAPAAAGTAGVANGHAVGASRWAPGSSSAAAAQLAAAAGGSSSCPNKTLLRSFVPFLSSCYNSSSSSSWLSWLGFAAAGLVAQGSVLAHADAAAGPHDPVWAAALSSAELAVAEAFQEALLDYDRAAAQQQQQQQQDTSTAAAPPNTSSSNRPQQPQVELQGHLLSVAIPILPNAEVAGLVGLIEEGLDALAAASSSSSSSTSSRLLGTSRVVQWESSRTVRQPPHAAPGSSSSSSREELRVQVMVPLQHGSPHEDSSSSGGSSSSSVSGYGRLSVVKPGSPFTGDELALLARLVAAANRPGGPGRGGDSLLRPGWRSGSSSSSRHPFSGRSSDPLSASPLARLFGGLVAGLAGDLIGGMAGDAAGDVAGGLAGDVAGDLAGDVAGDLAGDLTGYSADDLVGDLANDIAGAMKSELQRSWKTLLDDLGGGSGSSDNFGSGSSSSSSSSSSGRFSSLEELEEHIEAQLRELAPPELLTWLQQFEQQARQQQQQQHQHQQDFPRSSSSSSSESSRYGGSNGHGPPPPATQQAQAPPQQLQPWQHPAARAAVQQLQQLGAQVYLPSAAALASQQQDGTAAAAAGDDGGGGECGWGSLAGYESQKQALEDYLLLPLKHPEVFERVASRTRKTAQPGGSRPRAVLFEGPPGTGKTSSARVLSSRVALPLVYVPLEGLTSKWYGESEQNMAKLFKACEALGGCVIFLDELDSLAGSRERPDMHEASRRLLGVLLREIDGFDNSSVAGGSSSSSSSGAGSGGAGGGFGQQQQQQRGAASRRSVLIGATNRRQDLDAALLSRFDLSIHFGLPDEACRAAILQQYAQHLPADALGRIAAQTQGFAGRDLRDVCEQTERQWASRIIRGQVDEAQLPGEADYLAAVQQRRQGAGGGGGSAGRQAPWLDGGQVLQM